jgi:hypothetical protein
MFLFSILEESRKKAKREKLALSTRCEKPQYCPHCHFPLNIAVAMEDKKSQKNGGTP